MMEFTCKKCTGFTVMAALLQCFGLAIFVLGFFPVKPALTGVSGMESLKPGCYESLDQLFGSFEISQYKENLKIQPQYNRVVLMIIDALPAEFIIGKDGLPPSKDMADAMPFIQTLLSTKNAIGFHSKAAPPTVTMPRLKAITSGAIAGFLDVAFNFNTQAMLMDNLIGQLTRAGWKMVMYGDETWLRLFPNAFIRKDGVSSFYVKDTVQVDENVTRHLNAELTRQDWDVLILHYLGLDHVGHLGGRSSPLMVPKLMEMDAVIQHVHSSLIHNNLTTTPTGRQTLLLLASDHGMSKGGHHGGASFEETDAAALFISGNSFSKSVGARNGKAFQVDLVPTLALLLGVPIPLNSVGVLLPDLFSSLTEGEQLRALEVNAWQLMRLLKVRSPKSTCLTSVCSQQENFGSQKSKHDKEMMKFCTLFMMAQDLHRDWKDLACNNVSEHSRKHSCNSSNSETVVAAYLSFLHAASDWLARGTTEKNKLFIYIGGLLMLISLAVFVGVSLWIWKTMSSLSKSISEFQTDNIENFIAISAVLAHACSFNSSSFVEEEQFSVYFLVVTMWFAVLRKAFQKANPCQLQFDWNPTPLRRESSTESSSPDDEFVHGKKLDGMSKLTYLHGRSVDEVLAIITVLLAGRLLRSWHRGGVNWAHLPDVAKLLDQADTLILLAVRFMSVAFTTILCCILILECTPRALLQKLATASLSLAALLILGYHMWIAESRARLADLWPNLFARSVYVILGGTALFTLFVYPWVISASLERLKVLEQSKKFIREISSGSEVCILSSSVAQEKICLNFIWKAFISCWCLLQLLLQQSVNTVPLVLILLQLLVSVVIFKTSRSACTCWFKIMMLYWMGASGHFGMGNTNTLATVDVAGAYIGLRDHSIFLSGLLAFIITYASPLLYMMGVPLMCSLIDNKNHSLSADKGNAKIDFQRWQLEAFALPCVVPLLLSSTILVAFTLVMLVMEGHLFIWSVFSPK